MKLEAFFWFAASKKSYRRTCNSFAPIERLHGESLHGLCMIYLVQDSQRELDCEHKLLARMQSTWLKNPEILGGF
jgi:hypothetical protein